MEKNNKKDTLNQLIMEMAWKGELDVCIVYLPDKKSHDLPQSLYIEKPIEIKAKFKN